MRFQVNIGLTAFMLNNQHMLTGVHYWIDNPTNQKWVAAGQSIWDIFESRKPLPLSFNPIHTSCFNSPGLWPLCLHQADSYLCSLTRGLSFSFYTESLSFLLLFVCLSFTPHGQCIHWLIACKQYNSTHIKRPYSYIL